MVGACGLVWWMVARILCGLISPRALYTDGCSVAKPQKNLGRPLNWSQWHYSLLKNGHPIQSMSSKTPLTSSMCLHRVRSNILTTQPPTTQTLMTEPHYSRCCFTHHTTSFNLCLFVKYDALTKTPTTTGSSGPPWPRSTSQRSCRQRQQSNRPRCRG